VLKIEIVPWRGSNGAVEMRITVELMGEKVTYAKLMPLNEFLSGFESMMAEATYILRTKCLERLREVTIEDKA